MARQQADLLTQLATVLQGIDAHLCWLFSGVKPSPEHPETVASALLDLGALVKQLDGHLATAASNIHGNGVGVIAELGAHTAALRGIDQDGTQVVTLLSRLVDLVGRPLAVNASVVSPIYTSQDQPSIRVAMTRYYADEGG